MKPPSFDAVDREFSEVKEGDHATFRLTLTADMVKEFAALSGDLNPLHSDEAYARETEFKRPIVHGMLLASFISRLVGMYLPGRRSLWLSTSFDFVAPAYAGDEIEVFGEIVRRHEAVSTISIKVTVTALPSRTVVLGKALVRIL